ncbi:hypothetical protein DRF58_10460 [Epilithonimonas hispanica]|uniref:Uncharacterized protein n=1 Tax=Epilithonimonas hispanica TaxID=358687 RepID=A0A3D9CWS1_9FLAO|nr:hypothetical protein DRF58_10460 [Epilithonimonas hispanica]
MQKMYFQEPGTCFPLQSFLQDALFSNIMSFPQKRISTAISAMTHLVIKSSFYNSKSLFLKNKIR